MNTLMHVLKTFDYMGPQINFNIRKVPTFKTFLGGIVSLATYIICIVFFIIFGKDLIFKTNPNVISELVTPHEFSKYIISNETFLAWRIEDFYGKKTNLNEVFPAIGFLHKYSTINGLYIETKEIKFINCTNEKFNKFFSTNSTIKPKEWNCFDFSDLIGEVIFGDLTTPVCYYLEFQLDICKTDLKSKKKFDCKDFRPMRKLNIENDLFVSILHNQINFSPNNYTHPLSLILNRSFVGINFNLLTTDNFNFKNFIVEQDDNWLFSNDNQIANMNGLYIAEKNFVYFTDEDLDTLYNKRIDQYQNNIYTAYLSFQKNFMKYIRKYA